jgi:hypothetical protein
MKQETATYEGLPLYKLILGDDDSTALLAVAMVDMPAIMTGFVKFRAHTHKVQLSTDNEQRIVSGPLLIPDMPIYRMDSSGAYYVMFDAPTIEQVARRYFQQGLGNNLNLMHKPNGLLPGITLYESFISDNVRGIQPMTGYEDLPQGTWFVSYHIDNEEAWSEVKSQNVLGFSIEGLFKHEPVREQSYDVNEVDLAMAVIEAIKIL